MEESFLEEALDLWFDITDDDDGENAGNVTSWGIVSVSRRTLLREVG